MKDISIPIEPIVEDNREDRQNISTWILNRYYYCPNCKAFQLPESKDLIGTIGECKNCGQKIDYKNSIEIA